MEGHTNMYSVTTNGELVYSASLLRTSHSIGPSTLNQPGEMLLGLWIVISEI